MRRLIRPPGWLRPCALGLALAAAASPAFAQEEVPADSAAADTIAAPADSIVSDSLIRVITNELFGVLADSAADSTFAVLVDPVRPAPDDVPGEVFVWDRERIRGSNALNLGELLARMAPGTSLVRANFFRGPIQLVDGPFGPAALDIRIDGRPRVPLIGAQADLSEIQLAMIDEVRVERRAGGWRVDLTTLRRTDRRAYSRIEAGSGDPGLESLRLVFTNGLGRSFAARAGFELLQVQGPPGELQGFSGGLAWLPGGGTSGVEVQYDQRSFERTVGEAQTGSRSRVLFGGRLGLGDHWQAGGWLGESKRDVDAIEGSQPARSDAVTHGGVELRGGWQNAWGSAGARWANAESLPSLEVELEAGVRPIAWLTLDAGGRVGSWGEFDTKEGRLGVASELPVARARIFARLAGGVRGAPYLATDSVTADSVEFSAVQAGVNARVGPFRFGGSVARQRVDRQLAFGTGFDEVGSAGPEAEVIAWQARAEVPVLPLSWLIGELDPVRIRGFFRRNQVQSSGTPLYVPDEVIRGEVYFEDTFLEQDLGVRLALGLDRRGEWMTAPGAGATGTPVTVAGRTSWDFDLGIRILDVLIFWRYDNLAGEVQQDLPEFDFPLRRQVFGVRWRFFQ
jgi:hypothetical protein